MATSSAGLNDQLIYYEFYLDSAEYSLGTDISTSPVNWPTFSMATNQPLKNVAAMKILEVQIPYSWHEITPKMVTGGFTTSKITFRDTTLGVTVPINLAVGSYTNAQFATALQTAINAAAVAAGSPNTYSVAFTGITGDLTVTRTAGGNSWQIAVAADATYYNAWHWRSGMFPGYTSAVSTTSLTFPNHPCTPTYLYVNSSKLAPLFNSFLPPGRVFAGAGGAKGTQICKIPINAAKNEVIHWQDPDPEYWFNFDNAPTISQADFFLTTGPTVDPADFIDLNGCPFSLKLGVLVYRDQSQMMYQSGAMQIRAPTMFPQ